MDTRKKIKKILAFYGRVRYYINALINAGVV